MQLGWIDFSKNERNKVLSVIHQLEEPAAVDELGLGAIRDGFADYFFSGTSTVQTRAKYFLIVPYILKEAGSGEYGSDLNTILKKIETDTFNNDFFINPQQKNDYRKKYFYSRFFIIKPLYKI